MRSSAVDSLLAMLLAVLAFGSAGASAAGSAELQLKAAFIYRFAQFTEWPASALARSDSLALCVVGGDPFGSALYDIEGFNVHQRPIKVRRMSDSQQIGQCHIAFIGQMRPEQLNLAIKRSRQFNVLSISDAKGFAADGGMIQFVIADDRIQFEINSAAAQQAELRLSSHLLKLARVVYTSFAEQ